jgi:hypothetical protein
MTIYSGRDKLLINFIALRMTLRNKLKGKLRKIFFTFTTLKRLSSILLLLIFCVDSFTFNTHYCYTKDGTRFYGDSTEYIRKAELTSHSRLSFYPRKYFCHNVQLDKHYQQQDSSFKNFNDYFFVLPIMPRLLVVFSYSKRQVNTLFSCRGGPPLISDNPFRGPPSC